MSDFEYQLLDKEKKIEIVDKQLFELEVQRFSLEMSEPNRLSSDTQQYTQWQSAMLGYDQGIDKLRKAKFKLQNG
tara:strand:+ start:200 stop:424 length:225 start_codon:yes stop_codon:yes gene_type:complete